MNTTENVYLKHPVLKTEKIRLFKLTRSEDGHIRGKLRVVSWDEALSSHYHALSYTWGAPHPKRADLDSARTQEIYCDDNTQAVRITKNLEEFLRCLEQSAETLPELWVDAICIDQSSIEERNEQVRLMWKIYQSAKSTLVWLGDENNGAGETCSLVERLATEIRTGEGSSGQVSLTQANFEALAAFFEHSWFSRAWVLQEVILAKEITVRCGTKSISWDDLVLVSQKIATSGWKIKLRSLSQLKTSVTSLPFSSMPAIIDAIKGDKTFLHTLIRARRFKATDSRDKVFALLGIAIAEKHLPSIDSTIIPAYNLDLDRVYHETAVALLEASEDVMLLTCAEGNESHDGKNTSNNPSWVPNWADSRTLGLGNTGYRQFSSGPPLSHKISFSDDKRILFLIGGCLDSIVEVGESKEEVRQGELFRKWMTILSALPPNYQYSDPAQSCVEAFWRTLITNRGPEGTRVKYPSPAILGADFKLWFANKMRAYTQSATSPEKEDALLDLWGTIDKIPRKGEDDLIPSRSDFDASNTPQNPQPQGTDDEHVNLYATTYTHAIHLRLFRTQNHYLGLGSQSVRVNDLVWIVPGSKVPLILRPTSNPNRFTLVGGAYVHGAMTSEENAELFRSLDFIRIEIE